MRRTSARSRRIRRGRSFRSSRPLPPRSGSRFAAAARGALLGAAASAIVVFFPAKLSPFLLVERQVVSETYFRPEGEVAAAARQVRNPVLADQLAQVAASIDVARRYPPDDWPYRR